jgi:hypothetical protein
MGPSSQCSHVPGVLTCHWLAFRSACLWPADDHAETKSQPQRRNVRLRRECAVAPMTARSVRIAVPDGR